jgi:hypothetical protein
MVEEALARKHRGGSRIRLNLPPSRMTLQPGSSFQLGGAPQHWTIRAVTIDGLSIGVEAEAASVSVPLLPADPGRPVAEPDEPIGRTELVLFEAPPTGDSLSSWPIAYVAASTSRAWKPVPIEINLGTERLAPAAIRRPAVIGRSVSALGPGSSMIRDESSSVIIELIGRATLLNADDEALMAGANLAILGQELIQFGRAEELAAGVFRLSLLLRGLRGTEWATANHAVGEPFCLIGPDMLASDLGASAVGGNLVVLAHGVGDVAPLPKAQRTVSGEAMRPPSPCHLKLRREGDVIAAIWTRRSHGAWTWLDEVDSPSDPFAELYRISIDGPQGSRSLEANAPALAYPLADLPAAPGDTIKFTVTTVGPKAVSHGISATLML